MAPSKAQSSEGDEFINIWTTEEGQAPAADSQKDNKDFYGQWVDKSSAKLAIPAVAGADALRALYPDHSLILTQGYSMNIPGFPGATVTPIEKTQLISNLLYVPIARNLGTVPGILADQIEFGAFKVTWKQYEFIIHSLQFPQGFGLTRQYFVLHKGPEEVSRLFLLAAGAWSNSLHDEIWVFNQGFWSKDHGLWVEIQKADWKDVILKEEFKKALQKDVYGFFASEAIYKELAIPWKRGLIMHGPPGNGKTISLKTIMKTCGEKGFAPLYVKSFRSWKGDEGAMADVFDKARQLSPCVIILEDLDSLINDGNRSFFLNQLDGLEGNDGLLVIGTTNHFDRLDPGLSTRPSRFDRKYKFDDPDEDERKLYCQYWQTKLQPNKEVDFPDRLVAKVAQLTDRFSFAYLKEVFVSSLVTFVGIEGEKPSFESLLVKQIETLRKQLDKSNFTCGISSTGRGRALAPNPPVRPPRPPCSSSFDSEVQVLLDALTEDRLRQGVNSASLNTGDPARTSASIMADLQRTQDSIINAVSGTPPVPIPGVFGREGRATRRTRLQEELDMTSSMLDSYFRLFPDNASLYAGRWGPQPRSARPYNPSFDAETSAAGAENPWNPFSRSYRQSRGTAGGHRTGGTPRSFGTGDEYLHSQGSTGGNRTDGTPRSFGAGDEYRQSQESTGGHRTDGTSGDDDFA